MREELRDPGRLEHILGAIDFIIKYTTDKKESDITDDRVLFFGLVKNVEIIGEAAYMLSPDFKDRHPQTPWRQIVGLRHTLVHGYYSISSAELWNVIKNDLKPLRQQIVDYLKEALP